jgi:hypothetical protein
MATKSTLRQQAERIADMIKDFAAARNWPPDEYDIYMRARPGGMIHVVVVTPQKNLRGLRGPIYQDYYDIGDYLIANLNDPKLLERIRLGVRSKEQVEEGGIYAISPDYRLFS